MRDDGGGLCSIVFLLFLISSLYKFEIDILEKNLDNCTVENQCCLGYFNGKREEFEDILERFLLLLKFRMFCEKGLALNGVTSKEVFEIS